QDSAGDTPYGTTASVDVRDELFKFSVGGLLFRGQLGFGGHSYSPVRGMSQCAIGDGSHRRPSWQTKHRRLWRRRTRAWRAGQTKNGMPPTPKAGRHACMGRYITADLFP